MDKEYTAAELYTEMLRRRVACYPRPPFDMCTNCLEVASRLSMTPSEHWDALVERFPCSELTKAADKAVKEAESLVSGSSPDSNAAPTMWSMVRRLDRSIWDWLSKYEFGLLVVSTVVTIGACFMALSLVAAFNVPMIFKPFAVLAFLAIMTATFYGARFAWRDFVTDW